VSKSRPGYEPADGTVVLGGELYAVGVDYDDVVATLEREGIDKVVASVNEILDGIATKRRSLRAVAQAPRPASEDSPPPPHTLPRRSKMEVESNTSVVVVAGAALASGAGLPPARYRIARCGPRRGQGREVREMEVREA
jgi:hypothetical protein